MQKRTPPVNAFWISTSSFSKYFNRINTIKNATNAIDAIRKGLLFSMKFTSF